MSDLFLPLFLLPFPQFWCKSNRLFCIAYSTWRRMVQVTRHKKRSRIEKDMAVLKNEGKGKHARLLTLTLFLLPFPQFWCKSNRLFCIAYSTWRCMVQVTRHEKRSRIEKDTAVLENGGERKHTSLLTLSLFLLPFPQFYCKSNRLFCIAYNIWRRILWVTRQQKR